MNDSIKSVDTFYLQQAEPIQSCFLALKKIICSQDPEITNVMKYGMPFFCYQKKMFCYLWIHKKYKQPYIGFVEGKSIEHPALMTEKRSRMKIMLLDPNEDIPLETIEMLLKQELALYR